ncbi:hypothetical protein HOG21_06545 [bacterium]|nr:hypothetical protein [bacterium]
MFTKIQIIKADIKLNIINNKKFAKITLITIQKFVKSSFIRFFQKINTAIHQIILPITYNKRFQSVI